MLFQNYSCLGEPGISKHSRSVLGNPQYYTCLLPLPRTQCSSWAVKNCRRCIPCSVYTAILVALAPWKVILNNPTKLGALAPKVSPGQRAGHPLRDLEQLLSAAHWRLCTNPSWLDRVLSRQCFSVPFFRPDRLEELKQKPDQETLLRSWPSPVHTLPHDFPFIL